jgi:ABC-type transport system involved in multi-copper enzyme maturation permease subunit
MNSTLVIARRELTEKRFVFISAIAFTLLTLIVPFVPGVHAGERRSALVIASLICAVNFTMGLAAILGSSIIGRELSDGRLSFYFSKPVPSNAIWFGKLIAALLLLSACFTIIAAPALIAGFQQVMNTWAHSPRDAQALVGFVLILAAAFFLLSHVIGTFVRSRSAWLVFDFIALAVCGTAIWLLARPLLMGFALDLIRILAIILSVYLGVAIIAAGAWQVARGRTDRKRSHMELSRFLWISFGCGLLVMAAFVAWVVSVSLTQVHPEYVEQSGSGSWAMITGKAAHRKDYHAAFLYNVADGRSVRLTSLQPWWGTAFSADEKTVAWFVASPGASELYVARLDVPMPKPTATGITGNASFDALSDDGSRIAIVERPGLLTVYDVRSKASLGSARIPEGKFWFGGFVTPDLVRIYAKIENPLTVGFGIFEYDVRKKTLQRTGEMSGFPRLSRDRSLCLVYSQRTALEIRDARTGALLTSVAPQSNGQIFTATFLRDGRIAAVEDHKEGSVVRLLSANGAEIRDIPLPGKADRHFITESDAGLLAVVMRQPNQVGVKIAVVDVNRGVVTRIEPALRPVNRTFGSRLLCMTAHGLVAWNPATGEKRLIAAGS